MPRSRVDRARELMGAFARDTGLTGDAPPRRYLWTDAFAVCNYLGLREATGDETHGERALELVDQVHRILGRHREDDEREGWISGLPEEEGADHPTAGGLRIGKERPERGPGEPIRPRQEWERDGQYYHYLTRWMHALERVFHLTGEPRYHRWAVELALAAHRAFAHDRGAGRGLFWKMSTDLSRPLVPTTGQHDPLDGLLTLASLRASAPGGVDVDPQPEEDPDPDAGRHDRPGAEGPLAALEEAVDELDEMCAGRSWTTEDSLGAGGLLVDTWRAVRLRERGALPRPGLEVSVGEDAAESLEAVVHFGILDGPAGGRLAFRELGLAIGLAAAERVLSRYGGGGVDEEAAAAPGEAAAGDPEGRGETAGDPEGRGEAAGDGPDAASSLPRPVADRLAPHLRLRGEIEDYWSEPAHRSAAGWSEHPDISRVMLATSLLPGGYLAL